MVSSTCPKEKLIVYINIKDMIIYCEVCECGIKKSEWVGGGRLTTRKHGIACGDIVVEDYHQEAMLQM